MSTDATDNLSEEGTDVETSPPLPTGSSPHSFKWVKQKPRKGSNFDQEPEGMTTGT